jgi:hypothetical protein
MVNNMVLWRKVVKLANIWQADGLAFGSAVERGRVESSPKKNTATCQISGVSSLQKGL